MFGPGRGVGKRYGVGEDLSTISGEGDLRLFVCESISSATAKTGPARLMFVDDSCQCSQSLVDFARIGKRLQHHDRTAGRITRSILDRTSVTEIVLWQDLVLFDRSRFSLIPFS